MKVSKEEKAEAIARLKEWMPKGTTVYTILRHVSKSGMQRQISVVVPWTDEEGVVRFIHPNYNIAAALGWRMSDKRDALIVGGCGMDMRFHLIHTVSSVLYGKNADGSYSHDGAYALKQEWL